LIRRAWSAIAWRVAARCRTSTASQRAAFTAIVRQNVWGSAETLSGPGSTQARGRDFLDDLLQLLDQHHVRSILDAPCGDCNWMSEVLCRRDLGYTGVDIVDDLITTVAQRHAAPDRRFVCLDMTRDPLPAADLVLCRDGLVHLSYADARAALRNFQSSGSRYLLATTFVGRAGNRDVPTGGWRVLNLEKPPFSFPPPLVDIDERCVHSGGMYRDKRLALWQLATLDL
jgi:methyltransferase family protein